MTHSKIVPLHTVDTVTVESDDRRVMVILDEAELAVRMCEASYGVIRPVSDPVESLEQMESDVRNGWVRAAKAATAYFLERAAKFSNVH